jgi:ubiquinone/menaquinone biosynthesis C-methylase UbiE
MNGGRADPRDERHRIEESFHDEWAKSIKLDDLLVMESFEAETAIENRAVLSRFGDLKGSKLLDLGCGAGEASVYFALRGAEVTACDISSEMLGVARRLADRYGVELRLAKMKAEDLQFPSGSFDRVFGNGVLHHVELLPAIREVRRVLKPGGIAGFIEPLAHNPVIKVYRRLAKEVRTETEAPLRIRDIRSIRSVFPQLEHTGAWLSALLVLVYFYVIERADPAKERYWKKIIAEADRYKRIFTILNRVDDLMLRMVPFLRWYCWNAVLICPKEKNP